MRTDVSTSKYSFFSTRGLVTTAVAFLLPFLFVFAGVAMACTGGCCPVALVPVAVDTCGHTPSGVTVAAATGVSSGEIICTLDYTWNWNVGCSSSDRWIRYCVQLRSREGNCADNVVLFHCEDVLESAGGISFSHTFAATAQNCYYCAMKAADHITGGGSCPTCGETSCYNGGNCTTTLTGGESTCALAAT